MIAEKLLVYLGTFAVFLIALVLSFVLFSYIPGSVTIYSSKDSGGINYLFLVGSTILLLFCIYIAWKYYQQMMVTQSSSRLFFNVPLILLTSIFIYFLSSLKVPMI